MRVLATVALTLIALGACSGSATMRSRPSIVLVPIGTAQADVLAHLEAELPAFLDADVRVATPITLPPSTFNVARKQYLGEGVLRELQRRDFGRADRVVGILDADAYAPRLNFIFGQARLPGRYAFVSLSRLHKRGDVRERALKVVVHELGHSFGYKHCEELACVMHFANTLGQLDEQGVRYCRRERRL